MTMSIPYDPSMTLGSIVDPKRLEILKDISYLLAPIDAAEDSLNDAIATRRSFDMRLQELSDLNIDTAEAEKQLAQINVDIGRKYAEAAKQKYDVLELVRGKKAQLGLVTIGYESPIDYNRSMIKKLPLAADSMKLNVQYFSAERNSQGSNTAASTLKGFISHELREFGDDFSTQAAASAQSQVNSQYGNHDIVGTLVISVNCTHKDAVVLAPYILDVDKAIRVFNQLNPDDTIETDDHAAMARIAAGANKPDETVMRMISGATYGSCFIGMVHMLNTTTTLSSEVMYSVAESLQSQMKIGLWFADVSGGYGIDTSFSGDAKNLLSAQTVTSHCTLVTMGSIASIKSTEVANAVQTFAKFDGAESMQKLATLQNATASDKKSIEASAESARTGKQMIAMETAKLQGLLEGLANIDQRANKVLDTNSMMDALADYLQKALDGNIGVPINYYLKAISKSELAEMWTAKYYPGKFLAISGDDSTPPGPVAPPTPANDGGGNNPDSTPSSDTPQ